MKLFAVYLGGRHPRGNIELHDVVFVSGGSIEETAPKLIEKWFGAPEHPHIDSWCEIDVVDGHRICLEKTANAAHPASTEQNGGKKLYYVNLGAYENGKFLERHDNAFYVCASELEAGRRAKQDLCRGLAQVHRDDVYEVDDCLEITAVDGYSLLLEKTDQKSVLIYHSEYRKIPR